jgi:L-histidine Nalpha-methyltransferase
MTIPQSKLQNLAGSQRVQPPRYGRQERLQIEHLVSTTEPSEAELHPGSDVIRGLSQWPKTLSPRYFYDDRGSQLFEQICDLPEYYLTRAETAILQQYAGEIVQLTGACEIVELGSGSSTKTRLLLDAYQRAALPLCYRPIDISAGILESSAHRLLLDYPTLHVQALAGTYELALQRLGTATLAKRMICFIGSTLGNLNPAECHDFLTQIKAALQPGEFFLLGVDLQKPIAQLEAAYNDSQGITAAFNLNLLRHLNRRFAGNFDLTQFTHQAIYNPTDQQIEMYLKSCKAQTVHLNALNLTVEFAAGEGILSEISRKFDLATLQADLSAQGLPPLQSWSPDHQFGVMLCQRIG